MNKKKTIITFLILAGILLPSDKIFGQQEEVLKGIPVSSSGGSSSSSGGGSVTGGSAGGITPDFAGEVFSVVPLVGCTCPPIPDLVTMIPVVGPAALIQMTKIVMPGICVVDGKFTAPLPTACRIPDPQTGSCVPGIIIPITFPMIVSATPGNPAACSVAGAKSVQEKALEALKNQTGLGGITNGLGSGIGQALLQTILGSAQDLLKQLAGGGGGSEGGSGSGGGSSGGGSGQNGNNQGQDPTDGNTSVNPNIPTTGGVKPPPTSTNTNPLNYFKRILLEGMSGPDVKALQVYLNSKPETRIAETGPGSPGQETDFFGPFTTIAVKKFQKIHNLPETGLWGNPERTAASNALKEIPRNQVDPTSTSTPTTGNNNQNNASTTPDTTNNSTATTTSATTTPSTNTNTNQTTVPIAIKAGAIFLNAKTEVFGPNVTQPEAYFVSFPDTQDRPVYLKNLKPEDFQHYYAQITNLENPTRKINAKVRYIGSNSIGTIVMSQQTADGLLLKYAADVPGQARQMSQNNRISVTLVPRAGNVLGLTQ